MAKTLALCVLVMSWVGCEHGKHAEPKPPPTPAPSDPPPAATPKPSAAPADRPKQPVDAQIAAIKSGNRDKPAGTLGKRVGGPDELASWLASDPHVAAIGNGETDFAVGGDAVKKLLGAWTGRKITINAAREVRDAKFGFVEAMLDITEPKGH